MAHNEFRVLHARGDVPAADHPLAKAVLDRDVLVRSGKVLIVRAETSRFQHLDHLAVHERPDAQPGARRQPQGDRCIAPVGAEDFGVLHVVEYGLGSDLLTGSQIEYLGDGVPLVVAPGDQDVIAGPSREDHRTGGRHRNGDLALPVIDRLRRGVDLSFPRDEVATLGSGRVVPRVRTRSSRARRPGPGTSRVGQIRHRGQRRAVIRRR